MLLAAMIKHHLELHGIAHELLTRNSDIEQRVPLCKIAKTVILQDSDGLLVAVMAADHALDIEALKTQLQRNIDLPPPRDSVTLFKDWPPSAFSPFAGNYGLRIFVDTPLAEQDYVYFEAGPANELIRVDQNAFHRLHETARFDLRFTLPMTSDTALPAAVTSEAAPNSPLSAKAEQMKFRIQKITELPPMPEIAQKIFSLNSNPYAHVQDLASIVALDPSLSAQIIRYARSPFFGYRGHINSVHDAISRVLGYDMVMNIAMGLASAAVFKHTRAGPLGLDAFWRHAIYSAVLAQSLAGVITKGAKPRQGMAYLAGLLHNFGFLLLGHLYPVEFKKLNDAVAEQPNTSIAALESDIVGVSHAEIGTWLMQAWNMPPEIIVTVRDHHTAESSDPLAVYPNLIRLVDYLLKNYDLGDAPQRDVPPGLIQSLGLTTVQIDTRLGKLLESRDALDSIAHTLAA